ncbi:MAG: starch-binding protein [Anaeromyxobacter sp.]
MVDRKRAGVGVAVVAAMLMAACGGSGPAQQEEPGAEVIPTVESSGITVYTSGYTHIYWWGSTPASSPADGTWPGVAMGTDASSGYRTYSFPNATAINLIFSNNGAGQTANLSRTTGSWLYVNGTWSAYTPTASVSASPGTSSFSGASLAVTLTAANPASGTYQVDSGAATAFTSGQVIPISGTDLTAGQGHTLTLRNGTATATYTYTKVTAGITVYTSSYTHVYWWSATPAGSPADATWPGVAMGTDPATGLRTYAFPNATAINLIFSNNGSGQTANLSRTTGAWLYENGAWSAYNPGPAASASPGTSSFSTSSLSVTLSAANPASGTYQIDAGATTAFTHGQVITLGAGLVAGQSQTLTVKNGTASATYTYTKVAAGITVYTSGYTHVYWWSATPAGSPPDATWPGAAMGIDSASGLRTYAFPNATAINLIFSNNGSGQTANLSRTTGAWLYAGGAWTPYSPIPSATVTPAGGTFAATQTVTLNAGNPPSGTYQWDSDQATAFTDGTTLTFGADWSNGRSRVLKVVNGTATNSYTFVKNTAVYPNTLGALYLPGATKFRLWSPDSSSVTVTVGGATYPMARVADFAGYTSIYEATVSGDLELQPYQFAVGGAAVRDPYALMVNPGTTQGVVMDMASIAPAGGWAATPALVNREDAIIYEAHVRDFTIDANSGVDAARKGKFLGMVQTGTTYGTAKTGLDHLKELGVTHVQLMPVYDFGTALYNWGYDPVNYNVPEEQYAQATDPVGRVQEFQTMVNELHKNGLRVVVDVVYNHTYDKTVLQLITGKYYTTVDLSGVGNSIDDGNPMVARMIQDSLEQWVRNYNVDGFRFDLLGVFYATNAAAWGNYLNATFPTRNLLLYGEPWNGYATDPNDAQKVRFGKMPTLAGAHVGVFNGGYRDDLRGPGDSAVQRYVVNQAPSWWGAIAAGSRGSITAAKSTSALPNAWDSMFAYDPEQAINYVSAHDNLNMWDKINYAGLSGGPTGYAGRVDRFTIGILMTSQGIPFFYEGDEMLHSKAYGGDYTTAKNSYRAGDNYNAIRWADKVTNAATHQFYRDAIALRRANPALRLTSWDEINTRVRTTLNAGSQSASSINVVHDASLPAGVVVNSIDADGNVGNGYELVVVYNNGNNFNLTLPAGSWTKIFDAGGAVSKTDVVCEGTAVTVFRKN